MWSSYFEDKFVVTVYSPTSSSTSRHMFTSTTEAFGKGGILHLGFRKTGRHIAALILEQMFHLFYLNRVRDSAVCLTWNQTSNWTGSWSGSWSWIRGLFVQCLFSLRTCSSCWWDWNQMWLLTEPWGVELGRSRSLLSCLLVKRLDRFFFSAWFHVSEFVFDILSFLHLFFLWFHTSSYFWLLKVGKLF